MNARQLVTKIRKHGWLVLMADGRLHVDLPAGSEDLLAELRNDKEGVRALLIERREAKRRKKAKPAPEPLVTPDSVPIMVQCRCSERPYPHSAHKDNGRRLRLCVALHTWATCAAPHH